MDLKKIKVLYNEVQQNRLLIKREKTFSTFEKAYEFCREIYMSGQSKGKPIIESERRAI
jgi:pterin-4a-carbinolamine dehydratase